MSHIYVFRHGESIVNALFKKYFSDDPNTDAIAQLEKYKTISDKIVPLTSQGIRQAQETKNNFPQVTDLPVGLNAFDYVVTSTFDRAIDTAEIVFNARIISKYQDYRLDERFYGPYQAMPTKEIEILAPNTYKMWNMNEFYFSTGFESIDDVRDRVLPAWHELIGSANVNNNNIAVVTHQVPFRLIMADAYGITQPGEFLKHKKDLSAPELGFQVFNIDKCKAVPIGPIRTLYNTAT